MLKCLTAMTLCQPYPYTIKILFTNYLWNFQSRFLTPFLPQKTALPDVPCPSIKTYRLWAYPAPLSESGCHLPLCRL